MNIIPYEHVDDKQISTNISAFFKEVGLSTILKQSNIRKLRGAGCRIVFAFIFRLIFTGKNLFQLLDSDNYEPPFAKDVVYRFLNSVNYNWQKFLLLLGSRVISKKVAPLSSEERKNVLIIDDSTYSRNRSKTVELLARVFDHARSKYIKGFRLLTLGWSDGNTFIPLVFSLLSSAKEKNRLCSAKEDIDKRTNGYRRRKQCTQKATEVMFELLEQLKGLSIPAQYLLFDSWFAFPKVIKKAVEYEFEVVCRLKAMHRVYYYYQGKKINLKQLYAAVKKKRSGNIAASVVVGLGRDNQGKMLKARIVFIRNNEKNNWVALLTTDLDLPKEEIIRTYGKRWDIEVFFKMNKSYLKLAKEFQGRSYDMMVAHTAIVFTRYIMLALESRRSQDDRSFGGMFFDLCDELEDIRFAQALLLIIDLFKQALKDCLMIAEEKIDELLDYFMDLLPAFLKRRLEFSSCES